MIFVTVGTHEQQFNRLIKAVDELVRDQIITDEVFMQIGYSTYEPKHVQWSKVINYEEMIKYEEQADIVITHGGPATFMSVLSKGKTPIVVPRLEEFGEHVNNHQLDFVKKVKERGYHIVVIEDIKDLIFSLKEYQGKEFLNSSNTSKFVSNFEVLAKDLFIE